MTGNPGLADIDQFMMKKISKTGNTGLRFLAVKVDNPLLINVLMRF